MKACYAASYTRSHRLEGPDTPALSCCLSAAAICFLSRPVPAMDFRAAAYRQAVVPAGP
jgi:hypothetical protein